jgi:hypothetical protein
VLLSIGYETVLGPIMFLCHMNDLPDCVNSSVRLFADNCLLYRTIKKEEDHLTLQADLKHLEGWANKRGMRFSTKKCYVLSINNKFTRHVSGTFLKFLLRKPSVALAFLHTLFMWMLHFRSFEIWSPKYGLYQ